MNGSEMSEKDQMRMVLAAIVMHALLVRDLAYAERDAANVAIKYADALLAALKGNPQ